MSTFCLGECQNLNFKNAGQKKSKVSRQKKEVTFKGTKLKVTSDSAILNTSRQWNQVMNPKPAKSLSTCRGNRMSFSLSQGFRK